MRKDSLIKTKVRESNMELLRIVAMLLVLTVHAGFYSLGVPTTAEAVALPLPTFARLFFQSVSVIAVLVFVLISGWFGIRFRVKSVFNFLFQCLFYSIIIFLVMLCMGRAQFTWKSLQNVLLYINSFWFIKAYLCLMIFAPVLNAFVETVDESQFRRVVILFFVLQSVYGWLTQGASWFSRGYSAISFFGLYLLARYVRLYPCRIFSLSRKWDMLIYWVIVLLTTITAFVMLRLACSGKTLDVVYRLTNPFIIAEALFLLLYFSKLRFQNKIVNWVAASCFSVFLIQQNPYLGRPVYAKVIADVYNANTGIVCVFLIAGVISAVFVFSILIDQGRKWIWTACQNFNIKKNNYNNSL